MTPAQHRRYLRHWSAAFSAHWCGVKAGQPLTRPGRPPSEVRDQVVSVAGRLAGNRSLSADHLRHACHVLVLGREKSSLKLTNKEQDLVIALFDRLAESGGELAGQLRLDAQGDEAARRGPLPSKSWADRRQPDADRKRVLWSLEHSAYPEPAIAAISRDKFATANWRGLDDRSLYELLLTVKRAAARKQAASSTPATPLAAT